MKGHARQLMTPRMVVISPVTSIGEAARHLAQLEIGGLPVVEDAKQVIGIVTEGDMLSALLRATPLDTPVETIMTSPVVTVDEFAPADTVVRLLRENRVHHLPVTRHGNVIGLITPQAVLHYFVDHEMPQPPEVA